MTGGSLGEHWVVNRVGLNVDYGRNMYVKCEQIGNVAQLQKLQGGQCGLTPFWKNLDVYRNFINSLNKAIFYTQRWCMTLSVPLKKMDEKCFFSIH